MFFLCFHTLPVKSFSSIQVTWRPPVVSWIRVNIDGVAKGCSHVAACSGLMQ